MSQLVSTKLTEAQRLNGIFDGILKLSVSKANKHAVQNIFARYVERMMSIS
jgi:hypothetical protein